MYRRYRYANGVVGVAHLSRIGNYLPRVGGVMEPSLLWRLQELKKQQLRKEESKYLILRLLRIQLIKVQIIQRRWARVSLCRRSIPHGTLLMKRLMSCIMYRYIGAEEVQGYREVS